MVGVLVIELGFVFSYVGGLGHPYPHGLPIAIVGPASEQKLVIDKIHAAGGHFDPIPRRAWPPRWRPSTTTRSTPRS